MTLFNFFLFAIATLTIAVVVISAFLLWLSEDGVKDDTQMKPEGLMRRLRVWLTRPTPRIAYRRDVKGRFRKVRKG